MRNVVCGALGFALTLSVCSISVAQGRYTTERPGYGDSGAYSDQNGGAVYQDQYGDSGNGGVDYRYGDAVQGDDGTVEQYGDTVQGDSGDVDQGQVGDTAEGGGDYRYGDSAGTVEGDGGTIEQGQYSDTAGAVEGDSVPDYRYGDAGTASDDGVETYAPPPRRATRSRSQRRYANCYVARSGRTVCR